MVLTFVELGLALVLSAHDEPGRTQRREPILGEKALADVDATQARCSAACRAERARAVVGERAAREIERLQPREDRRDRELRAHLVGEARVDDAEAGDT